jgi:hypothetical protein
MSAIAVTGDGRLATAGWIKTNLGVNDSVMLRLVACGRVRHRAVNGSTPRFCVDDVLAWLKEEGRDVEMPQLVDRRRRSAAKPASPAIPVEPTRRRTTVSTT